MSIAGEQWMAEGRQEGFHQGLLQGEATGWEKGLLEGEASLLLRMLRRRFGALADAYEDRVRSASGELLEMWSERILDAPSLTDIFDPRAH